MGTPAADTQFSSKRATSVPTAKMSERVKQVAAEEAERVKVMTKEAVQSRAYLYPFKGIFYFVSHKDLWRPLISRLAPTITLSIGVTTFMFLVAYVPQAAVMAFTSGPVAAISAALLTLSESSTLITSFRAHSSSKRPSSTPLTAHYSLVIAPIWLKEADKSRQVVTMLLGWGN